MKFHTRLELIPDNSWKRINFMVFDPLILNASFSSFIVLKNLQSLTYGQSDLSNRWVKNLLIIDRVIMNVFLGTTWL